MIKEMIGFEDCDLCVKALVILVRLCAFVVVGRISQLLLLPTVLTYCVVTTS